MGLSAWFRLQVETKRLFLETCRPRYLTGRPSPPVRQVRRAVSSSRRSTCRWEGSLAARVCHRAQMAEPGQRPTWSATTSTPWPHRSAPRARRPQYGNAGSDVSWKRSGHDLRRRSYERSCSGLHEGENHIPNYTKLGSLKVRRMRASPHTYVCFLRKNQDNLLTFLS